MTAPADVLTVLDSVISWHRADLAGLAEGSNNPDLRAMYEGLLNRAIATRAAVAELIAERDAAMEICRNLAALRDGLDNSNSSAEEMASRLAHKAAALARVGGMK